MNETLKAKSKYCGIRNRYINFSGEHEYQMLCGARLEIIKSVFETFRYCPACGKKLRQ